MRPINLIPLEERRGEQAPLRSGALPYILIGALVVLLVGVTALVMTGNEIADREAEIVKLEREDARESANATRLAPYTKFRELSEQRVETVASLANSRFDWERVMREMSLILPANVWLVNLLATAAPGVTVEGGSGGDSDLRGAAPGPALQLTGCTTGQDEVAGFVTALKDIEGVTRVGVQSAELPEKSNSSSSAGGSEGSDDECRTRRFIVKFEIVVAFDAAPIPPSAEEGTPAAPVAPAPPAEGEAQPTSEGTEG